VVRNVAGLTPIRKREITLIAPASAARSIAPCQRDKLDQHIHNPRRPAVFSQTAEYALRAVAHLSHQHPRARTTAQIAAVTRVPADYLSKVLKDLARAGVVTSRRGLHGGFSLATSPDALTVFEVVNAMNPIRRIERCPLGLKAHAHGNLCPLHRLLDDAMGVVEKGLRAVTLQQLADAATDNSPLGESSRRPVQLQIKAKPPARSQSRPQNRPIRSSS
jgi:Rrf2 family protein